MIDIQKYLKTTHYCDLNNPEIQKIANEYLSKYKNQRELAVALFCFVRDNVKYSVGSWSKKASVTLREKTGMCTNSSNLLVALLRACKIPSAYCIYHVVGGESFGHILPNIIKKNIDKDSVHIIVYVFLDKRWIKCDPSTDIELSERTKHISKITELVEWDGITDSVHQIDNKHIISISEPLDDIDYQLDKKPRLITKLLLFRIGNIYIKYLRKYAKRIENRQELEQGFIKHIKNYYILDFLLITVVIFSNILWKKKVK